MTEDDTDRAPCNCDVPSEGRLGPCPRHEPEPYRAWLAGRFPRYAAAQDAGDLFVDRDEWPPAHEIAEFAALRAALTPLAREAFDTAWALTVDFPEGYSAYEDALMVRDEWPALVAAAERDALRGQLSAVCSDDEYPLRAGGRDAYELFYGGPADPGQLRDEADKLAQLARRALDLERLIRSHLAEAAITRGGGES